MSWSVHHSAMAERTGRLPLSAVHADGLSSPEAVGELIRAVREAREIEAIRFRADVVSVLNAAFPTGGDR